MNDEAIERRLIVMAEIHGHGPFKVDDGGDLQCRNCLGYVWVYRHEPHDATRLNTWRASGVVLAPCRARALDFDIDRCVEIMALLKAAEELI